MPSLISMFAASQLGGKGLGILKNFLPMLALGGVGWDLVANDGKYLSAAFDKATDAFDWATSEKGQKVLAENWEVISGALSATAASGLLGGSAQKLGLLTGAGLIGYFYLKKEMPEAFNNAAQMAQGAAPEPVPGPALG